ncbi:MAG: hypothetical protein JXJ19_04925 [Elusimicrobia bacterium]|nr:hypothetical protein [Elusimicrobiota bacterium]
MDDKKTRAAVLYSGGTDSTLAAALASLSYGRLDLLTFRWCGLHNTANSGHNISRLRDRFPSAEFSHSVIGIDRLAKHVFYERYLHYLRHYGFFVLSVCGLCKLSMHVRAAIYCMDNGISGICDGASKGMDLFPAQMRPVIEELKKMYGKLGIEYFTPVYEYDSPNNPEFIDRLHLERFTDKGAADAAGGPAGNTAGDKLYEMGILPEKNVKGTALDRKMQSRCFQFILHNIFVRWYYLPGRTYGEFEQTTAKFYAEKIGAFTGLLLEYKKNGGGRLKKFIQPAD